MTALAALQSRRDKASDPPHLPTGLIASLGRLELPLEFNRAHAALTESDPCTAVAFRFLFREVPFVGQAQRRDGRIAVTLRGDLGYLPFTIENARRRRRLRTVLTAANHASGMRWEITAGHAIRVSGEMDSTAPFTPTAIIATALTLLLRSRLYLDLAVAVAGEE
jgi:hypothetical protein